MLSQHVYIIRTNGLRVSGVMREVAVSALHDRMKERLLQYIFYDDGDDEYGRGLPVPVHMYIYCCHGLGCIGVGSVMAQQLTSNSQLSVSANSHLASIRRRLVELVVYTLII